VGVRVGYMELCLDREMDCGCEVWLYGALCGQIDGLSFRVCYMELCVY
jgi:hypothetical protein